MNNDERDKTMMEIHTAVTVIAEKVENHDTDLYGNGKPGIKMDVDRLKQNHKRASILFLMVIPAVLALVGRLVFVLITN